MNIFEEISKFNSSKQSIMRTFHPISSQIQLHLHNNQKILNFCSNDYLRLSKNTDIINAGILEMQISGTGSGGTRNISGTNPLHNHLENTIADFHQKEEAILFNSAYVANVGALYSLGKFLENVTFFSDEQNHASIIHGINLSKANKIIYQHNNLEDLALKLSQNSSKNKIIVCESIYSMNGTITDLQHLVTIAQKHNCLIYLDEVHAIGIYGNGKGIAFEQGISHKIDIINGTFGKAIGCIGGYIATTKEISTFIKLNATTFIFSTSLPPFICASILKSLEISSQSNTLRTKLFQNITFLKKNLKEKKINFLENNSHIIIIPINDLNQVKKLSQNLLEKHSIYIQPIFYPTVPFGQELLRITVCPQNTNEELSFLAESISTEMQKLAIQTDITTFARKSILSKAQAEIFINNIKKKYPQYTIEENYISTFGDSNTHKPIHELEHTNAFAKEIQEAISANSNKFTIGISSLKDIEIIENPIQAICFLERTNPRDILILNHNTKNKIKQGNYTINIGTSSLRRKHLIEQNYEKFLPNNTTINLTPLRGNIDTRLQKLDLPTNDSKYLDGIIIAAAGLFRLSSSSYHHHLPQLLQNKTIITLPISLIPTPPGQGTIVCQGNAEFKEYISKINNQSTEIISKKEKMLFHQYGKGCKQSFGITTLKIKNHECSFIKGITDDGRILNFTKQEIHLTKQEILQMCDSRKFNLYQRTPISFSIPENAINFFIASTNAITPQTIPFLQNAEEIWASGIKTHEFLTKNGILCNGSVESFGFDELQNIRFPLNSKPFYTLTYQNSEENPNPFTISTYSMQLATNSSDYKQFCDELCKSSVVLWTNTQQFKDFHHLTKPNAKHVCMLGKTYDYISQKIENKKKYYWNFQF